MCTSCAGCGMAGFEFLRAQAAITVTLVLIWKKKAGKPALRTAQGRVSLRTFQDVECGRWTQHSFGSEFSWQN